MSAVRISSVAFLNARPLVRGFKLAPRPGRYLLSECTPSVCAQRLAAGAADVALIPGIEYQRTVVPWRRIASRRSARSQRAARGISRARCSWVVALSETARFGRRGSSPRRAIAGTMPEVDTVTRRGLTVSASNSMARAMPGMLSRGSPMPMKTTLSGAPSSA